jgi:site-specific DNA-methyltransferase (adenine-specific)
MSKINLIYGDSLAAMKLMPDKAYELAIVDPPYGIGMDKGGMATVITNKSINTVFEQKEWDKKIPDKIYFDELIRVTKKQVIWGGNHFLDFLGYCKAPVVWDKLNGDNLYADGEMAWTGGEGIPRNLKIFRHQWCGAFKASERGNINIHPTQKPVRLYEWLLKNYAKPGDTILDTHAGSFSLGIACDIMGYDCTGYEIDADYYQAAKKRLERHQAQGVLF